jgi:hypothetical protein
VNDTATKPAKAETLEVIIVSDYWPAGNPTAIRKDIEGNEHAIEIDIELLAPVAGKDSRLRTGDVVTLPRKDASMLINKGAAKLPEME